jgi:hypothetical protein
MALSESALTSNVAFRLLFSPGPKTSTGNRSEVDDTKIYLAGTKCRLKIGRGQCSGTRVAIVHSALNLALNDVLDNGAADANMG